MPDKNYSDWAKKAWKILTDDYINGEFIPLNEFDIQAHMYHCMIESKPDKYKDNRLLTGEWGIDGKTIDLAVVTKKDIKRPRLLIELKETSKKNKERIEKIYRDISKLEKVSKHYRKKPVKVIGFFFRNYSNGIPSSFIEEFDQKAKKLYKNKVILLYGPK